MCERAIHTHRERERERERKRERERDRERDRECVSEFRAECDTCTRPSYA